MNEPANNSYVTTQNISSSVPRTEEAFWIAFFKEKNHSPEKTTLVNVMYIHQSNMNEISMKQIYVNSANRPCVLNTRNQVNVFKINKAYLYEIHNYINAMNPIHLKCIKFMYFLLLNPMYF